MQVEQLRSATGAAVEGPLLITPQVFGDERGWFFESWNQRRFDEAAGEAVTFAQDNHSRSAQGVLRGLHYQLPPCLLYTSPSPRDGLLSRMPSSA